ncbi:hypothetical protein TRFO_01471 [Tritrichomonas foetus]|uniref:Uncharacterized protein n=1 Tax=Tritrichomonas foetus TaxID=1144522 RepID=A0A1J4JXS3_9EUKA|nr:hypothetical protein TRFO_01471 [Tritrichomonas foetus]|eukprot:OHT03795.1 hypothetical protein TRFO_01471 [Tritrichomonas foetus]
MPNSFPSPTETRLIDSSNKFPSQQSFPPQQPNLNQNDYLNFPSSLGSFHQQQQQPNQNQQPDQIQQPVQQMPPESCQAIKPLIHTPIKNSGQQIPDAPGSVITNDEFDDIFATFGANPDKFNEFLRFVQQTNKDDADFLAQNMPGLFALLRLPKYPSSINDHQKQPQQQQCQSQQQQQRMPPPPTSSPPSSKQMHPEPSTLFQGSLTNGSFEAPNQSHFNPQYQGQTQNFGQESFQPPTHQHQPSQGFYDSPSQFGDSSTRNQMGGGSIDDIFAERMGGISQNQQPLNSIITPGQSHDNRPDFLPISGQMPANPIPREDFTPPEFRSRQQPLNSPFSPPGSNSSIPDGFRPNDYTNFQPPGYRPNGLSFNGPPHNNSTFNPPFNPSFNQPGGTNSRFGPPPGSSEFGGPPIGSSPSFAGPLGGSDSRFGPPPGGPPRGPSFSGPSTNSPEFLKYLNQLNPDEQSVFNRAHLMYPQYLPMELFSLYVDVSGKNEDTFFELLRLN